mmetsp:Transcript_12574/g.30515  ORF Transcript_12574/g.30515 Transcript_12574/m.30515 type:complete len:201 (+) Transcript_12574:2721-3323(+)
MDMSRHDAPTTVTLLLLTVPSPAHCSTDWDSVSPSSTLTSFVPCSAATSVIHLVAEMSSNLCTTSPLLPPPFPAASPCATAALSPTAATSFISPLRSLRSCLLSAFLLRLLSVNRFFFLSLFFCTKRVTSRASLDACASYLLSKASIITARNSVRKVYLPTMTHTTKKTLDPHPAYSTVLNMMNSQSSSVNTLNTSRVLS